MNRNLEASAWASDTDVGIDQEIDSKRMLKDKSERTSVDVIPAIVISDSAMLRRLSQRKINLTYR